MTARSLWTSCRNNPAEETRFNPRTAVVAFAETLRRYGVACVTGDAYGGTTFRNDFEAEGIRYEVAGNSKSVLYEALEPRLNAGEVELPDIAQLTEQLLTLVWRGARIDHQVGDHDDFSNAVAGVLSVCAEKRDGYDLEKMMEGDPDDASRRQARLFAYLNSH